MPQNNPDKNTVNCLNFLNTYQTHEVSNQPEWPRVNLFSNDQILQFWLKTFNGNWGTQRLSIMGKFYGNEGVELGEQANQLPPKLQTHDRNGNRIDVVEYNSSYHQLMHYAIEHKIHALPWTDDKQGSHAVRAAMEFLHMQADAGSGCPLTMTFAAAATLKHCPSLANIWLPLLLSNSYDGSDRPYFEKQGITIGMAMTEKQGGSDVRRNTTFASPINKRENGAAYLLVGHKWFCSAPMSDAFFVLAQTDSGLSCFLLPRWTPEGEKNRFQIQRLKNKLGNHSNASSEIEYRGAFAWLIGEEGAGVKSIIDMVSLTRFDCMVGSSALMRSALSHALNFTTQRHVFKSVLSKTPLMKNVLADLALESEAATALSFRVAHALDKQDIPTEKTFIRFATAVGKYWICKRAPHFIYEAMECIGGIGYIEDNYLPRLYREAPVNAIWEGSGNIQCLDLMRAIMKQPQDLDNLLTLLKGASGRYDNFDLFLSEFIDNKELITQKEGQLRSVIDKLAKLLIANTLIIYGEPKVAEIYCMEKLTSSCSNSIGTLSESVDFDFLIERALLI
ncbi:acyl-CoA dehydrogenase family protein [Parashewanella tropica]|uniref:acyl-CoA dehydrogenase family protein n=1 Tax=Parashewanella tropica TaxID=2547970 RepID=UPI001059EE4A|nr:acyl-CoA dehydrogenase family protein [Parashewanella tropica]